jgi:hypothetical protein
MLYYNITDVYQCGRYGFSPGRQAVWRTPSYASRRVSAKRRPHSAVIARLDRATQYAAASRFHRRRLWNTGSPAFAGDDNCAQLHDLAACVLREVFFYLPPSNQRAQGMPGVRCTRSLAYNKKQSTRAYSPQVHRNNPAFPARWFSGCSVLAPVHRACWPPSSACLNANLTPASRCQAHTTLPSASGALVRCTVGVHRIPPRVRDDHDTPLLVGRDGVHHRIIRIFGKAEYFCWRGLTAGAGRSSARQG